MAALDDLLKEFDDLAPSSTGAGRQSRPQQQSASQPHHRSGSTPPSTHSMPMAPRSSTPSQLSATSKQLNNVSGSHGRSASVSGTGTVKRKDELDALLNELDFGGTPNNSVSIGRNGVHPGVALAAAASKLSTGSSGHTSPGELGRRNSQTGTKQKCSGVFVGGTSFPRGRQGAVGGLTMCDALRCTKCDFRVESFDNREWDADVDYLFFRNNFPTEAKLAPKLRSKRGAVAYCCQCSWLTAVAETKVDFASEVRWVCAGHLSA